MNLELGGFHHLTAVTADAPANLAFYTRTLGLRLVKRTVNQDDTTAYHLFYADGAASPGSDITFFDWPVGRESRGTCSVVSTGYSVASADSLAFWRDRLPAAGEIVERDGRATLRFEDPEGQRLMLIADGGLPEHPWERSPVPARHQLKALAAITISVPRLVRTERVLVDVMGMRRLRNYASPDRGSATVHVFGMGPGGLSAELHVLEEAGVGPARQGAGGVHHVAFRVTDRAALTAWTERLTAAGVRNSGEVERFYFRSLYFREPGGVLFELATDGPGFAADEPLATLGEKLSLPPFLEGKRAAIEARLKPIG